MSARCILLMVGVLAPLGAYASCPTCSNPNLPGAEREGVAGGLETDTLRIALSTRLSTARSTHESSQALSAAGAGAADGRSSRAWAYDMVAVNLDVEHALSTRFGWAASVPVRYMSVTEVASGGADDAPLESHPTTHVGLGDLSLYGTFYLRTGQDRRWWFTGRLGLTVPTGNTLADPNQSANAEAGHEHIFFGTGTVDPRVLLMTGYRFDGWTLQGSGHVRSTLYENRHGYQAGTQGSAGVGLSSSFGLATWRFSCRGEVFHGEPSRWKRSGKKDLFSGRSGYLTGVEVSHRQARWEASLGADLPFIVSTVDGEFEVPVIIKLATAVTF